MKFIFFLIKKIFDWGMYIIKKYTTGLPFLAWAAMGTIMSLFLFIFRNSGHVQFDKIVYVLLFSMIWFVTSDIAKKKKIIEGDVHFFIDSTFYLGTFGLLFYFTGGMHGYLFFLFFLIAISAPLFGSLTETLVLLFLAFLVANIVNLNTAHELEVGHDYYYESGIIFLAFLFHIGIALIIKMFQRDYQIELKKAQDLQGELEKRNETLKKEIESSSVLRTRLEERTDQLERLKDDLQKRVEGQTEKIRQELEENKKINRVTIDRELKMAALKKEIKELKKKLK